MPFTIAFARGSSRGHDHQSPALAAELLRRGHRVTDVHLRTPDAPRPDLIAWRDPAGLELARRWAIPDVRVTVDPVDPEDPQPTIACFPRVCQPRGELVADHVLFAGPLGRLLERPVPRRVTDPLGWRWDGELLGSGGVSAAADWLVARLEGRRPRPDAEVLVEIVLLTDEDASPEEDAPRRELLRRADHGAFTAICRLLDAQDAERRDLGVLLLGVLGAYSTISAADTYRPFRMATLERLGVLATTEEDPDVLSSIPYALSKLGDPRCVPIVLGLRDHPDADVRYEVAGALMDHETDDTVAALIELTRDEDDDVRDWATFGLAIIVERDTPEIRAALLDRLEDSATREHAAQGLAYRGVFVSDGEEA